MNFEDLTPEQQERARSAKNPEEILALAKETGYELSDDELDGISGGSWCPLYDENSDPIDPRVIKPPRT